MEWSDETAVARAKHGDADAFAVLVDRHSRSVFRLAYRVTGNEQDAEDVVQESFLRAWREIRRFDSRASFGTWLYRIASNCALDRLRSNVRKRADSLEGPEHPSPDPPPDRIALSGEVRERMEQAMTELSAVERTAFVLRHYEGLPIEEIGRALGCQAGAARHSVFRAVQKLRRALEPLASTTK